MPATTFWMPDRVRHDNIIIWDRFAIRNVPPSAGLKLARFVFLIIFLLLTTALWLTVVLRLPAAAQAVLQNHLADTALTRRP